MRIYLAGRYGRRKELAGYAAVLESMGCKVTSRWLRGLHDMKDEAPNHAEAVRFAREDLEDLTTADLVAAFTESPGPVEGRSRGGRHVELGYALASRHRVCVVGHRENVFCHLPKVEHYTDFAAFMEMVARNVE